MNTREKIKLHPFGGCDRLLSQYEVIGAALLSYERIGGRYGADHLALFSEFREQVAFVPVEVLESYLEDLLDLEVEESKLALVRERASHSGLIFAVCGLALSFGAGVLAAELGAPVSVCFALTVALSIPCAVMWHLAPKSELARRMAFAKILSQEISRRRGRDRDDGTKSQLLLGDFLSAKGAGGTFQGAARNIIVH